MLEHPVLEIHRVTKRLDKRWIIHPFSLTMDAGQAVALCGGNGAGKSTLIRMIVGLSLPTSGTIRICGLERKKNGKSYAERLGYMPDDFQFAPGLTARETLYFYAALRRVSQARAEEVLCEVGLEGAASMKVSAFSKGMRQRLLFAQALLANPPLLVLDEPTNGLDPRWMNAFMELVLKMKKGGQAILFSTHQLEVAEQVADRIIFLNEGVVLHEGSAEQFRQKYGDKGIYGAFARLGASLKAKGE